MPINTNFGLGHHSFNSMPGGFRGPNSSNMPNVGMASSMLEAKLIHTVTFLHHAPERAGNLNRSLANIPNAFRPQVAMSENPNVLQVNSFSGGELSDLNVTVHRIATTQRNSGTELDRQALVDIYGTHTFEIEVDGNTHSFSIELEGDVTNNGLQVMMRDAINAANLGITATVTLTGNNSTLSIETGTVGPGIDGNPRFTIRDVTGSAVELTGVADITQPGQNAQFSVNGGAKQTNATNCVDLGNGLVVTLVAPSEEPVGIFVGQDRLAMQTAARQVVNHFNDMLEIALLNAGDRNTRMVIRELQNVARFNRRELERIGITTDNHGFLTINESVMNNAAENGQLQRFFAGTDTRGPNAFLGGVSRIASNVVRDPMRHVSPHARRIPGFNEAMDAIRSSSNNSNNNSQQRATPAENAYFPDDFNNIFMDLWR